MLRISKSATFKLTIQAVTCKTSLKNHGSGYFKKIAIKKSLWTQNSWQMQSKVVFKKFNLINFLIKLKLYIQFLNHVTWVLTLCYTCKMLKTLTGYALVQFPVGEEFQTTQWDRNATASRGFMAIFQIYKIHKACGSSPLHWLNDRLSRSSMKWV